MLTSHGEMRYSWEDGKIYSGVGAKAKALRDGCKFLGAKAFRVEAYKSGVSPYLIECTVADYRGSTRDGTSEDESDDNADINGCNEISMAKYLDNTSGYIRESVRESIPDDRFAGPHRSFPIRDQHDLDSAVRLIGHAPTGDQAKIRERIKEIAKEHGLSLPSSWT